MTFVCKWLRGFEMAFFKFLFFSRWGGRISALGRLCWVEADEKTLISCLSSDIWLFGFSLFFTAAFSSWQKKKGKEKGGFPKRRLSLPFKVLGGLQRHTGKIVETTTKTLHNIN